MIHTARLGDVTRKIGSGLTPRGGAAVYVDHGAARLIRSQNVLDNALTRAGLVDISESVARDMESVAVEHGDVLLNITGDSIARVAVVEPSFLPARVNQHVMILRCGPSIDSRFLQRVLVNRPMKQHLISLSSGGTRKALTKAMLESLTVPLPPLPEQQAIAEVLGALDDKIAANSQLVKTALELVGLLHSQTKATGVQTSTLYTDVADVGGGATPSTKRPDYWDGGICWVAPSDVTGLTAPYLDDTPRHITQAGLDGCSSPLYPVGSILMTSRATIGAFAVNEVLTAVNQGFIVVTPHSDVTRWWLLHEMMGRVPEYLNRANGATFLELPRGVFKTMSFDLPAVDALTHFHEAAEPIHARALAATRESRTLAELRDTMLPALMDGTIRVKDAISTAEVVL